MPAFVIAVVGPTAVGKSDFAVALARSLGKSGHGAEIISADSRQIYKKMVCVGKYTFRRNDTESSQRTPAFIEKYALIVGQICNLSLFILKNLRLYSWFIRSSENDIHTYEVGDFAERVHRTNKIY